MKMPFQVLVDNIVINGVVYTPINAVTNTHLLIIYGLDGNQCELHRFSLRLAQIAEKQGITTWRFDFRGCGCSDGDFMNTNIRQKCIDCEAVMRFIKVCQTEKYNLFLLSLSDGAKISCKIATKNKELVKGLILCSPILLSDLGEGIPTKVKLSRDPLTNKILYPFIGQWMGLEYLRETLSDDSIIDFYAVEQPILTIIGENDNMVRSFMEHVKEKEKTNMETISIQESDHIFNSPQWTDAAIEQILKWIEKQNDILIEGILE